MYRMSLTKSFCERNYNKCKIIELEKLYANDPKRFWSTVNNLGPRKSNIPMSVYDTDGLLSHDITRVLNVWSKEFSNLLKCSENDNFDYDFYNEATELTLELEKEMSQTNYVPNIMLNDPISFDEVEKTAKKLKSKKAIGIDKIPNEVLRCEKSHILLFRLFSFCFEHSIIPSAWKKAIITPIPKKLEQ